MLILLFPAVLFLMVFVADFVSLSSPGYEMDSGNGTARGSFFPLLILYQVLFYVVAGLGIFGAIYARSVGVLIAPMIFLASTLYAILFNVLLILFYEGYLHLRYPSLPDIRGRSNYICGRSNYTRTKYALIRSLGASAILTLIGGAVWTAITLR